MLCLTDSLWKYLKRNQQGTYLLIELAPHLIRLSSITSYMVQDVFKFGVPTWQSFFIIICILLSYASSFFFLRKKVMFPVLSMLFISSFSYNRLTHERRSWLMIYPFYLSFNFLKEHLGHCCDWKRKENLRYY